jgi:hypothetical protein
MTASKAIMADLDKLDDVIRQNVQRVAGGGDVPRVTPAVEGPVRNPHGSARPVAAQTMSTKIGPHRNGSIHDTQAPSTSGSTKPAHTWPAPTPFKAESGLARPGRLGSMPSKVAPGR